MNEFFERLGVTYTVLLVLVVVGIAFWIFGKKKAPGAHDDRAPEE